MNRSDIVRKIMDSLGEDTIVVASTGLIARQVFYAQDRPLNFYMMGSMGQALSIGIGIAMNTKHPVVVISGDGAVLMSLGTLVTRMAHALPNLFHYIIDNNCHESTGAQNTASSYIEFEEISFMTKTYHVGQDTFVPPRITLTPKQITKRFKNAFNLVNNKPVKSGHAQED